MRIFKWLREPKHDEPTPVGSEDILYLQNQLLELGERMHAVEVMAKRAENKLYRSKDGEGDIGEQMEAASKPLPNPYLEVK